MAAFYVRRKLVRSTGPWTRKVYLKVPNLRANANVSFYYILGSFSIDDGDGRENVTLKMNSSFFKLCREYSNSLAMSNVSEFLWSCVRGDRTQF